MSNCKSKVLRKGISVLFAVALMCFIFPGLKTQAAVSILASPKDAQQTVSTETGVRVSWTGVTGATAYVYSYSSDNKTYTGEALTGNGGKDTFVNIVPSNWTAGTTYYVRVRAFDGTKYSEYTTINVATAPKAPVGIRQTAADNSTATVSWDASTGATGYLIKFGATQATAKDSKIVTTTSVQLTGLSQDSAYYIAIYPVRKVSATFYASQNFVDNAKIVTTAGAVTDLKLGMWDVKSNIIMLQWKNSAKYENGYQIELYKADGTTLIKSYKVAGRRADKKFFALKAVKNTPFQYRIRTYTVLNGKDSYGAWSNMAYAIPQANVKAEKVNNTAVKLSWTKVKGAKRYTVYQATKEGGKYKKVATTKKAYYTVKNLKAYKDYYYYVKANTVKIGGKNRNSTALDEKNDINVYIFKYQNTVSVN